MKRKWREKRERDERKDEFFQKKKNVSRPSNPPDELAQNVSKKNPPSDELFLHFFCKSSESGRFSIYLHDSNSIFWAQGIKSEGVSGGTPLRERRGRQRAQRLQRVQRCTIQQWIISWQFTVGGSSACRPSDGFHGCVTLVHAHVQDHPKMQRVGDFNMKHRHPGRRTSGLWSDAVLGQSCEKHLKRGARKVRPRVEQTSCLQTCGQEACGRCDTAPTMTCVQLRLVMCTRHAVLYARMVVVETALRTRQTHTSKARPCHSWTWMHPKNRMIYLSFI